MNKKMLESECNDKTCPWWTGYSISGGLRRIVHNPYHILKDYVKEDMRVLDAGCGMGFLAISAAELVGERGKVIAVDLQSKMLSELKNRAEAEKVVGRIELVQCKQSSLMIDKYNNSIDFAYAFMMVHEVEDKTQLLKELYNSLKPGCSLLIAEPIIHVTKKNLQETVEIAKQVGFSSVDYNIPKIKICNSVLLTK